MLNENEDILRKIDIYHIANNEIKTDSLVLEDPDQKIVLQNRNEKTNNNNNDNNNNDNNNNINNINNNSNDNDSKTGYKSDYSSMNNIINNDNNSDKHKAVEICNDGKFPPILKTYASDREVVNDDKKYNNFEINKDVIISNDNIIDRNECTDIKSADINEENDINLKKSIANENSMDSGCKTPVLFLPRSSFKFMNSRALESQEVMIEIGELVGGGRERFWSS